MKNKVVYLGLAVDLIHPGHLNIINDINLQRLKNNPVRVSINKLKEVFLYKT